MGKMIDPVTFLKKYDAGKAEVISTDGDMHTVRVYTYKDEDNGAPTEEDWTQSEIEFQDTWNKTLADVARLERMAGIFNFEVVK